MGVIAVLGTIGKVFNIVPIIVSGIEHVMGKESSKSKLDSALEIILPFLTGNEEPTQELIDGVILIINGTVKVKHALGEFESHKGDN